MIEDLTKERYAQLLANGNTEEDIEAIIEEWGIDSVNKGYDVFDYNGTGCLNIERIDEVAAFDCDAEAIAQAMRDGIKIIPVDELPESLHSSMRFLGWVDTEENRKALKDFAEKFVRPRMKGR